MMKSNRKAGKKAPFPVRERDFCHAKPKRALRASWNGTYNAELLKFAEKLMAHTQGPVETKFGNKSLRFFFLHNTNKIWGWNITYRSLVSMIGNCLLLKFYTENNPPTQNPRNNYKLNRFAKITSKNFKKKPRLKKHRSSPPESFHYYRQPERRSNPRPSYTNDD